MSLSTSCLLCSHKCSPHTTRNFMSGKTNYEDSRISNEILGELHMHFVLRKLLQIPESSCEKLISTHEGKLSRWGSSFCLQCSCLIQEAKELSHQISTLLAKFECLQQKLQDKVMHAVGEDNDSPTKNVLKNKSIVAGFPTEVRRLCLERMSFLRGGRLRGNVKFKDDEDECSSSNSSDESEFGRREPAAEELDGDYPKAQENPEKASTNLSCIPTPTADILYTVVIKNSPPPISEEIVDEASEGFLVEPDGDYLDPGSILQVVSDIGGGSQPLESPLVLTKQSTDFDPPNTNESTVKNECTSSKKDDYFKKIMELHSSQAKNTVLITKEKYRRIAVDLKHLRDTGKRTKFISNYYKRYELLEFMDTVTLVRSGTQKRVVAAEDLFDVINAAHIATNHGGRDSILKHLKEDFFNVTKHQVNTFLSMCDGCSGKRVRKR